jgi:hypothetical protein
MLAVLVTAAVGALAVVVAAVAGGQVTGSELLPDLRHEPPSGLVVRRDNGRTLLAFASAVGNVGAGDLIINGRRNRGERLMTVTQEITRVDGSVVQVPLRARLKYQPGGHNHWHLQQFDRFDLRDATTGRVLRRSPKVGFCLGSRYQVEPRVPGTRAVPRMNHNCGRFKPGLMRMRAGIDVGWVDDYAAFIEGQSLDITGLPAGRYMLVHEADPGRLLLVGNRADDVASALVEITPPATPRGVPGVLTLARCEATASCA